ncbi:hypothetical protein L873DRAFT_1471288 [Choiromyces venosus 120613-1]|uniref:Uncharacterized protein n=1 Tax=Choiromyces venosus 120613-1 TaxID=1336337 RepID=A0A3N4JCE9_9PEZI|nr:hypothetical protein L873DRAFT_1471288 [Choiromyces venosus 120613-1]
MFPTKNCFRSAGYLGAVVYVWIMLAHCITDALGSLWMAIRTKFVQWAIITLGYPHI